MEAQLLHCPKEVPLALLVMPKCGKTASINWAASMEGEYESLTLDRAGRLLFQVGPNHLNDFIEHWLYPELGRAKNAGGVFQNNFSDGDAYAFIRRSLHRFFFDFEAKEGKDGTSAAAFEAGLVQQFVPPAHLCPTCCGYGVGRQLVIVGRNPFLRLTSYFRFRWLNYETERWPSWQDFPKWLQATLSARQLIGEDGGYFSSPSWKRTLVHKCKGRLTECDLAWLDDTEVFHLRPLGDVARDPRSLLAIDRFQSGFHVVHLERVQEDVAALDALLCKNFGFCGRLPSFPRKIMPGQNLLEKRNLKERCDFHIPRLRWRNCSAPAWGVLWTNALVNLTVHAYSDDFAWLGYHTDPLRLLPL